MKAGNSDTNRFYIFCGHTLAGIVGVSHGHNWRYRPARLKAPTGGYREIFYRGALASNFNANSASLRTCPVQCLLRAFAVVAPLGFGDGEVL